MLFVFDERVLHSWIRSLRYSLIRSWSCVSILLTPSSSFWTKNVNMNQRKLSLKLSYHFDLRLKYYLQLIQSNHFHPISSWFNKKKLELFFVNKKYDKANVSWKQVCLSIPVCQRFIARAPRQRTQIILKISGCVNEKWVTYFYTCTSFSFFFCKI